MIENMVLKIKKELPLKITNANWDGTSFQMYGVDWTFNTLSAWRIVNLDRVLVGCYDKDSNEYILSLKDIDIIDILMQENTLKIDPVFVLSNDQKLEIFSTDTFEPWTFGLHDKIIFVPTPSDPSAFN